MPHYVNAEALLLDAELRADGLGHSKGILVVEGPDDKRVFARHVRDPAQVLPAGGRKLLLSAHQKASDQQRSKMIFVTDCDYEVRRGNLKGAPDLVITTLTDMESDLFSLGLSEVIVLQLVPQALESLEACRRIAKRIKSDAEAISLPLGRLRMASQPLGVPLSLGEIRLNRYWDPKSRVMDLAKLVRSMHTKISDFATLAEWEEIVHRMPQDSGMCHGKDLVRAFSFLLKSNYGVDVTPEELTRLIRSTLDAERMDNWDVIRRIRVWQGVNQRIVLAYGP
ncbi:hypothetical protein ABZ615_11115 [Streptomyces sp. NPDC007325]|uniref:hypothetical protein n=1 Tax=Streptomyces sp. NPDC007325 TaxID=3154588 RepID=UPI0033FDC4A4